MFFRLMLFCSVYINYVGLTLTYPAYECGEQDYIVGDLCCPKCPPGKSQIYKPLKLPTNLHILLSNNLQQIPYIYRPRIYNIFKMFFSIGKMISEDCKKNRATICTICTNGTFQEGLNQQRHCVSNCTKCDEGLGLKVKKSCSSTSDAVCEVLDGFFCSDSNGGGCRTAQRHTVCRPGQYIGQRGTADKDTECLHCTDGTFSDGTSSCQPHTTCESVGLKLTKPGTDSTDSECGEHGTGRGHVVEIIPGVILVMALMALIIAIIHRKKRRGLAFKTRMKVSVITCLIQNTITCVNLAGSGGVIR
ncbi:tumor necrosis factor receptor superfamily member 14-like isoform X2 [Gadus chalcogrammus]|uniref:tumor necrosis factor receptor superfamily member 14-like isoform X2 n=1 Tax=Gadus chalcogrammus TaxID=1042646 RepID=UPI0024C26C0B|nr:tumor necrosis factor receptor superfamily member 14-like isoform X2 [Gadus chalcogrammus]